MNKLIPLTQIPYAARAEEAKARATWPTRAMALDAATLQIVMAPGCYGGPDAPTIGWVLTREAAEALAAMRTYMPGGTSHRRLTWRVNTYQTSDALGEYIEAIARGEDATIAAAAYRQATA